MEERSLKPTRGIYLENTYASGKLFGTGRNPPPYKTCLLGTRFTLTSYLTRCAPLTAAPRLGAKWKINY